MLKLFEKWSTCKLGGFEWHLIFLFCLTLSVVEKLKKLNFWDSSNSTNFNHQELHTELSAESINLDIIRKLIEYSSKKTCCWRHCLLLPFSRYQCLKVHQYYHLPCWVKGVKGLTLKCDFRKSEKLSCWCLQQLIFLLWFMPLNLFK